MKELNRLVGLFMLCLFCCSDTKESITTTDEITFRLNNLADDGWKSKKINNYIGNINYTATEVPVEYYIIKEEGLADLRKIDSISKAHKNERVIEFQFAHDEEKDLFLDQFTNNNYENTVKYMAFEIRDDFLVVTSKGDTIACSGATLERNFKIAPFKKTLLFFGGIPEDDNIQLIYNDQLFGSGLMKFTFKDKPLKL